MNIFCVDNLAQSRDGYCWSDHITILALSQITALVYWFGCAYKWYSLSVARIVQFCLNPLWILRDQEHNEAMSGNGDENVEQAIVVEKVDSAIRWINFSPVDNAIG